MCVCEPQVRVYVQRCAPLPRTQRWAVVLMRSLEREASRFSAERVEAAKIMLALVQVGGRDAPAQFAPAGC